MTTREQIATGFPSVSIFFRSVSWVVFPAAALLAGCATQAPPGLPSDPVLTADPNPEPPFIENLASPSRAIHGPQQLWTRIRQGFSMPNLQNDLVTEREQWYTSRPGYIRRTAERSEKYLFHIVEEIERRHMPTELALLPFVESDFNPDAASSAKAVGLWQFTPATGRSFHLKQDTFHDDRRDVLASTRAALDYLQTLHRTFNDWHLALAAYNWGEGSVGRAIAKNRKAGLGISYKDLTMPSETRLYVPKLQAVKNIVANPHAFKAELPPIKNHPYFQQVLITRDIDVTLASRLADIKIQDFKALNPSRHPNIIAARTSKILLPWDNAKVFQRNFAAHSNGKSADWRAWTAPVAMSPAEAAKLTGMDEAELSEVNHIPPHKLIKGGSSLLVRRSVKIESGTSSGASEKKHISPSTELMLRRDANNAGRQSGKPLADGNGRKDL